MPPKHASGASTKTGKHGKRPAQDSGIPGTKKTKLSGARPGTKKNKSRSSTTEVKKSGESGDKTKATPAAGPGAKIAGGSSLVYDFHKGYVIFSSTSHPVFIF